MTKIFAAAFWALVGAALVLSIYSANSISKNLKSAEQKIDEINLMLDELNADLAANNTILKELTNEN